MRRKTKHRLHAGLFFLALIFFRLLPLDAASAFGAFLGARLGPRLKKNHRTAARNLDLAFPEKTPQDRAAILRGMWAHLGRVMAEFAHLNNPRLLDRLNVTGRENLPPPEKPVLFVSGHFGNWELTYPIAHHAGVPIALIYRHADNPYTDRIIIRQRSGNASAMFPKGPRGAARLAGALKRRQSLALLFDQKMNEGIPVPFFGHDAMTAPAVAQLSLRFNLPIIAARAVRTKGAHFNATIYPPLSIPRTGDEAADIRSIMQALNRQLEGWIREHPEQWFWIHRRFDKSLYS